MKSSADAGWEVLAHNLPSSSSKRCMKRTRSGFCPSQSGSSTRFLLETACIDQSGHRTHDEENTNRRVWTQQKGEKRQYMDGQKLWRHSQGRWGLRTMRKETHPQSKTGRNQTNEPGELRRNPQNPPHTQKPKTWQPTSGQSGNWLTGWMNHLTAGCLCRDQEILGFKEKIQSTGTFLENLPRFVIKL